MITATVDKNSIKIDHEELLTSGSVKTNFIQFVFSEDWNGLTKTAIFQTKKVSIPVIVDGEDKVAIPWEAMAFPKEEIKFGVYGVRFDDESTESVDEEIVLPTIWGSLGKVVEGVKVEQPPITDPTKDAYLQLLDYIKNLQPGGGSGVDERISDGTLFISSMDTEPTLGFDYPVSYNDFVGLKPSNAATYLGLLRVGNDFYISSVTVAAIDDELNDIQVRFDSLTKLAGDEDVAGGIPYVDQLVAPPDTYSAHDVESLIGKSLYYLTWSGDPMKTTGKLEIGKEFTAYFLYDGEQLNPTLNYYGVFVCDEYDPVSTERIKATLKNATLIGNRTESLNSFLTFFKLDTVPELNVTTSIPFKSAVGVLPQWMNTAHRGLMTVGNELYLIDFRLEWLDHDNEAFQIKFTAIYPISNSGRDGIDGVTFIPFVSSEGVISFVNDGGLPNPDPVNIKGPTGATGEDALVYSEVLPFDNVTGDPAPINVYSFQDSGTRFNRAPKLNETWTGVIIYYSGAVGENVKDVFVSTFKITGVSEEGYTSLLVDKKSVMPTITTDGPGLNEDSFVTIKDQELKTPNDFITVIGLANYTGCIHAINSTIPGSAFMNDLVWISYQLISGTYYLDFVTADGHCEAWTSTNVSVPFSRISSTNFLPEDELDLAEGTTFIGHFATTPEVDSTMSMQPDWFIGKKPTVGGRYRGKIHNDANKWYDMVINVAGITDYEGTAMYTVEVLNIAEVSSGGTDLTAGDGLSKDGNTLSVSHPVVPITEDEYGVLSEIDKKDKLFVIRELPTSGTSGSLSWWSPHMTSANTPAPYEADASSVYSDYYAYKAFDGNPSTAWSNDSSGGDPIYNSWLKFSFGETRQCHGVRTRPNSSASSQLHIFPLFTIQGSTDSGSSWNDILTVSSLGTPTEDGWYEFLFDSPAMVNAVRFTKMSTTEKWSGNIGEIEFLLDKPSEDKFRLLYEDKSLDSGDKSLETYSTEETRIGTWIDGKPLYQRVITGLHCTGTNVTLRFEEFGKASLNIDELPIMFGSVQNKNNDTAPLNYLSYSSESATSLNFGWYFQFTSNDLCIMSRGSNQTSSWNEADISIIIKYTKTTDEPEVTA